MFAIKTFCSNIELTSSIQRMFILAKKKIINRKMSVLKDGKSTMC